MRSTGTLERLLGIALPVVQAPMAGSQDAELAAAVSNAGGLGSLPCALLNSAALAAELRRLRALTDRPFNLNFFCHETPAITPREEEGMVAAGGGRVLHADCAEARGL